MVSCENTINTKEILPIVTTSEVSFITCTTAKAGGLITLQEGAKFTESGICWGTETNPTLDNNKIANYGSSNSYTLSIFGLTTGTTYFVRAYAKNNSSITYGNEVSFSTPSFGSMSDIDGNVYKTIKIGNQIWMAENLKVTRYQNGDLIPTVTDAANWKKLTTGGKCSFNNNDSYINTYGYLYNWFTINDVRKIAPVGWHIPSDNEWSTLIKYLIANGYNADACTDCNNAAKSLAATTGWTIYNHTYYNAIGNDLSKNNKSGFSALPGGRRTTINGDDKYDLPVFLSLGNSGYWWSSTEYSKLYPNLAISKRLDYNVDIMGQNYSEKQFGLSIRCIKD